ncbi:MAG: hypothetical protein ACK40G_00665 [Cytophagaceae bacterium]
MIALNKSGAGIINRLNVVLNQIESRTGLVFASVIVGLILLIIAVIYVTPALEPMQLGRQFAKLSIDPFDFSKDLSIRYRVLTPLLAYLLGLRGPLYIIFPTIIAVVFMAFIYFQLRKKNSPASSFLITSLICFSTPVLFLLHFQGYVDITSYLLIGLAFVFRRNFILFAILLSLLLLNHDSNIFILPALLYWFYIQFENKGKGFALSVSIFLFTLIPFFLYRNFVSEQTSVTYSAKYYLDGIKANILSIYQFFPVGFFYAFKLFWIFPILGFYYLVKERKNEYVLLFLLVLAAALGQLILASDTSRLIGLAFPLVIAGAVIVKQKWGEQVFLSRTAWLILINFLVPQFYVGQSVMILFYPLPVSWFLKQFLGIETWIG